MGIIQDKMRIEHKTKSGHMMLKMNIWSALFSGIVSIVSGECISFIQFLHKYPASFQQIMILSLIGALGQYFIFLTVSEFGPLACSISTTTRKCFTLVISVALFGHTLILRQWLAAVVVFVGLFLDIFYGKSRFEDLL